MNTWAWIMAGMDNEKHPPRSRQQVNSTRADLPVSTASWPKHVGHSTSFIIAAFVFLTSAIVFIQYGFEGTLRRDAALYLYSGQQMAQGVPPYVSVFEVKGPLTYLIPGIGASIAMLLKLDDIIAVRVAFLILSCLAIVGLYFLGSTLFESRRVGLLAAFTFIGFWGFGRGAVSGPSAKTPVVLFQLLSLLLTARKRWFWAGLCGSLAALTWQPTAIFPLATILLALTQSRAGLERARNAIRAVSGILIPIVVISLYFLHKGALSDLVDGAILFHLNYLERGPSSLLNHLRGPIRAVYVGFTVMAIPIALGFLVVCMTYMWRMKLHGGSILRLLARDRFAALLLSFPALVIWSLLDFQGYGDFFVLLPYVAIGFGWLLYLALEGLMKTVDIRPALQMTWFLVLCATLIGSAAMNYYVTAENGLDDQRQWAQWVESRFGRDSKIVSIGEPSILVLLHSTNPNPYVYIISGFHNRIEAKTPGGFEGWLEELEREDLSVIALGKVRPSQVRTRLIAWLETRYQETHVGEWTLFVKSGTDN